MSEQSVVPSNAQRAIIHLKAEVIKGFLEEAIADRVEALWPGGSFDMPATLRFRRIDTNDIDEVPVENVKAIFFVSTFEGHPRRKDVRFHATAPLVRAVWLQLEFTDGEIMEGLVDNAIDYIVAPGFFLLPTDPNSNNRLIYVFKRWIKDCHVLGLRKM
jgi:hypothetical protein